ncbi:MAG: arsenate reductase ArsC [Deltaproteobacteria bacterium]|nr:MAG: arsenate reductase ArsC [Deltaproteobacteria bacterium]
MIKKVLFVCVENSCRSQMAEAFAKIHGKNVLESYSAGSQASGKINQKAIKSMQETGYDLGTHKSKSLSAIPDIEYDFAITMGCGDECPYVRAKQRQDWVIQDPKNMNQQEFNKIRDRIEEKILSLIKNQELQ